MNSYLTLTSWKYKEENPLELVEGQEVMIDKRVTNTERDGWVWCVSSANSGWVPDDILTVVEETDTGLWKASVNEDFSGKELNVTKGEVVEGNRILNNWMFCYKGNEIEQGWLPMSILQKV